MRPLSHKSGFAELKVEDAEATITSYALCFAPRAESLSCHENLGAGSSIPNGVLRLSTHNSIGPRMSGPSADEIHDARPMIATHTTRCIDSRFILSLEL